MRIVHWQNGEQVSRTVLTLRFQLVSHGPPGNWHAAVCARAILAYLQVAPWNHEDWEEVYTASVSHRRLQRMPSNGGEFSSWLYRSTGAYLEAPCVEARTKPRMRTYTTYVRTAGRNWRAGTSGPNGAIFLRVGECMAFLASGSEHTMTISALAT